MNSKLKWLIILLAGGAFAYFVVWFFSIYIGWYAREPWKYRMATKNIDDAKKRSVFIRKLNYKVVDFPDTITTFQPYIERGFKYGEHSFTETVPLENTDYPYQLSFNSTPKPGFGIFIRKDQLQKFDSSNASWGYLKHPFLPDTITLDIMGENVKSGLIKVW